MGANGVAGTGVTLGGVTGTEIAAGTEAVAAACGVGAVALPRPLRIVIVTGLTTAGGTAMLAGVSAAGVSAAGMLTLSLGKGVERVPDGVNVAL